MVLEAQALFTQEFLKMTQEFLQGITGRQYDSVQLKIREELNINHQNNVGDTGLHVVARNNNTEIAKMLLDQGADITILNNDNKTPLDLALEASLGHEMTLIMLPEYLETLLEPEAHLPNRANNNKQNVLQILCKVHNKFQGVQGVCGGQTEVTWPKLSKKLYKIITLLASEVEQEGGNLEQYFSLIPGLRETICNKYKVKSAKNTQSLPSEIVNFPKAEKILSCDKQDNNKISDSRIDKILPKESIFWGNLFFIKKLLGLVWIVPEPQSLSYNEPDSCTKIFSSRIEPHVKIVYFPSYTFDKFLKPLSVVLEPSNFIIDDDEQIDHEWPTYEYLLEEVD
jgi:hypothetical protein